MPALEDVAVDKVKDFQGRLTDFLSTRKTDLLASIRKEKALTDDITHGLKAALTEFNQTYR